MSTFFYFTSADHSGRWRWRWPNAAFCDGRSDERFSVTCVCGFYFSCYLTNQSQLSRGNSLSTIKSEPRSTPQTLGSMMNSCKLVFKLVHTVPSTFITLPASMDRSLAKEGQPMTSLRIYGLNWQPNIGPAQRSSSD